MNGGRPMDYYNLSLEKSVLEFDQRHVVKIGASYDLPCGPRAEVRQRHAAVAGVLRRRLDAAVHRQLLQRHAGGFGATGTPNSNFDTNRPFLINPNGKSMIEPELRRGAVRHDGYFGSPSRQDVFQHVDGGGSGEDRPLCARQRPAADGPAARLRASTATTSSLQKNFVPKEGIRVQFRAEFLNLFNRHRFSGFNTNPASPLFGQISGVTDDRRQIQFGVRADF